MKRIIVILMIAIGVASMSSINATIQSQEGQNISSIATVTPTLKSGAGYLELTVPTDETTTFYIYSITGQLIKTITATSGITTVELPRGYYIVKCERWSKQAVVK